MPEGHTIHRLARDLAELNGEVVEATSPQGKFAAASDADGSKVEQVRAHGKHLLVDLSTADSIHVHLGMRGKWLRFSPPEGPALKQVRLRLATATVAWDLIAPTTCELLDGGGVEKLLAKLGPDPLRDDFSPDAATAAIRAFRGPIGAALMDQQVVSGIGNVYRAEILHVCGISPLRSSAAITDEDAAYIWSHAQQLMRRGVDDGRIITVDAEDRLSLPEADSRRVYKQERCRDCGTSIVTTEIAGRTSYHCPQCQPD